MKLSSRGNTKGSSRIELAMTSMIDVVFLLLIFFLVTTAFATPERQLESAIKLDHQASAANPSDLEPALIDVYRDGSKTFFRLGATSTSEISELKARLVHFSHKIDGAFVRVSGDVPFEKAAQAMAVCKAAGFRKVAYVPSK